jgi:hypothetical protein
VLFPFRSRSPAPLAESLILLLRLGVVLGLDALGLALCLTENSVTLSLGVGGDAASDFFNASPCILQPFLSRVDTIRR